MNGDLSGDVRRRRLDLRLTQRQAATKAGVSLATWQSLERRGAVAEQFAELTLARVAHGLGLPVEQLQQAGGGAVGGAAPEGPVGSSDAGVQATDAAVDALIDELSDQLRALADVSPETFRVVHGQASDAATHFLQVLREG